METQMRKGGEGEGEWEYPEIGLVVRASVVWPSSGLNSEHKWINASLRIRNSFKELNWGESQAISCPNPFFTLLSLPQLLLLFPINCSAETDKVLNYTLSEIRAWVIPLCRVRCCVREIPDTRYNTQDTRYKIPDTICKMRATCSVRAQNLL